MSKEVADRFIEALRKLEEERDVEALLEIHTEDCEAGNVSVQETFRGHDGLREFWTNYRKTFGEMRSTFRNVFATEERAALEWTTEGTSDGDTVAYDGVSILEIESK
jgi:ketosteroid isomerase-like protein